MAPERLLNLRRVATIESIGSSTRIDGVKLSDREVRALLTNLEIEKFKNRGEQEVAGYADVMATVIESWEAIDLTENHIKQLHGNLLQYTETDQRDRGGYKTLAIHPFQDGNGRLSRVLTTLLLLRTGYAYVPYASLESIIEKNEDAYYLALRQTQATVYTDAPDWQPWVMFFLTALQQQKRRLGTKLERERIMLGKLPSLSVQILEIAREHGRVTVADAAKVSGVSRNTVKDHIKTLRANGYLAGHGSGRGAWYTLSEGA